MKNHIAQGLCCSGHSEGKQGSPLHSMSDFIMMGKLGLGICQLCLLSHPASKILFALKKQPDITAQGGSIM